MWTTKKNKIHYQVDVFLMQTKVVPNWSDEVAPMVI